MDSSEHESLKALLQRFQKGREKGRRFEWADVLHRCENRELALESCSNE